jgi:hypothetical protein
MSDESYLTESADPTSSFSDPDLECDETEIDANQQSTFANPATTPKNKKHSSASPPDENSDEPKPKRRQALHERIAWTEQMRLDLLECKEWAVKQKGSVDSDGKKVISGKSIWPAIKKRWEKKGYAHLERDISMLLVFGFICSFSFLPVCFKFTSCSILDHLRSQMRIFEHKLREADPDDDDDENHASPRPQPNHPLLVGYYNNSTNNNTNNTNETAAIDANESLQKRTINWSRKMHRDLRRCKAWAEKEFVRQYARDIRRFDKHFEALRGVRRRPGARGLPGGKATPFSGLLKQRWDAMGYASLRRTEDSLRAQLRLQGVHMT